MKPDPLAECAQCGKPFVRSTTFQRYCNARRCTQALLSGMRKQEAAARKAQAAAKKAANAELRRRKEAAKPTTKLRVEAQTAFNAYIRARDYGLACICCGKPMPWGLTTPGGAIDAGHYMSRGSCPELSFDPQNVSAQLKSCNRAGGTTRASFRAGMVERWGLEVVQRLEGPNPQRRFRADDYREIRDTYRAKLRELKKEREA